MSASSIIPIVIMTVLTSIRTEKTDSLDAPLRNEELSSKKLELFDGVSVKFPLDARNDTKKLFSLEVDLNKGVEEGRGKQKKLMQRILPMFIMPFLIQSAIIPMFLSMLKFMLMKSLMVGKIALLLIIINAFKNHNAFRGRQEAEMADIHYGYHGNGMEEYGAYVN